MRLVELYVTGFGKLVDRTVRFAPGFNLIFGPNEAGKSTLQQAILTLLYGFFEEGTITAAKRATLSALQPWDTRTLYAGSMTYLLDNEQTFQIARTFAPRTVTTLLALPNNVDVSSHFRSASHGRLFFADEHLGMSREVFEKTCYVRQAELVALETSADSITDALMRLSTSATTDTTATEAIALLDDLLKESVGTARARTKPLPQAQERLASLEAERSEVMQQRNELFSQITELRQSEEHLQQLDLRRQQLHYLHMLAEMQVAAGHLTNADAIAEDVQRLSEERARWAAWSAFPAHLHGEVVELAIQRRTLQKEISASQPQAIVAREQLQALEAQAAVIDQHIAALADVGDVQTAELPHVQELAQQWRSAAEHVRMAGERGQKARATLEAAEQQLAQDRAQMEPAIRLGLSELAGLRQRLLSARQRGHQATANLTHVQATWAQTGMEEAQFQQLERTIQAVQTGTLPTPTPRKGCRSMIVRRPVPAQSQTPAEFVIYADVKPLHASVLQARTEAEEAQRLLNEIEASIVDQLGGSVGTNADERALVELSQRLERYLQTEAAIGQQRAGVDQLRSEFGDAGRSYEAAHARLRSKLTELGSVQGDTQAALTDYQRRCEQRAQLERDAVQLEQLQLRADTLRRLIDAWQVRQRALDEVERQLRTLLTTAGVDLTIGSIEDALAGFGEAVNYHKRWTEAETAYQAALKHQQPLGSGRTSTDERQSLSEMETRLVELRAVHPEWAILRPDKMPQEYNQLIRQADKEWADARQVYARSQDAIHQTARTLRHPAEIDEEIGTTRRKIQQLERLRDALEMARTELEQTAQDFQRQFAPQLELLLREGLSRVTRDRYTDVRIDPGTLAVMLRAPEIGDFVSAQRLSTGTRDIVYLMLRVSIARLMSRSQERLPLLLDDPLVQCDHDRLEQALNFLSRLAEETQILLFTKDEATRTWFEEHCADSQMHRLHVMRGGG
jgi:DNA repair exonuclease SbcCD ATPase subunit